MNANELKKILGLHAKWLNSEEGGERADLSGADLDYSCLPLWYGSLSANFDDRQLKQIAYHLVKAGLQSKNASKETKTELRKLIPFANGFHRAEECGLIMEADDEQRSFEAVPILRR